MPFSRTEPNVPAYEEDPNSPFTASQQSSLTVQLANPSRRVLIVTDPSTRGFDQLQVNGVRNGSYDVVTTTDTQVKGSQSWELPPGRARPSVRLLGTFFQIGMETRHASSATDTVISGRNSEPEGKVTQFTLSDAVGGSRDVRGRVFTLDV